MEESKYINKTGFRTHYRGKLLITDTTSDIYSSETFVQKRQLLSPVT